MKSFPIFLILVFVILTGCRKNSENIIWGKNFGTGKALFVKATTDSGLISCGVLGGKPYLLKLDRNKNKVIEYKYRDDGLFSSAWHNNVYTIVAGSSKEKILIACIDNFSNLLWDTTLTSISSVDNSSLCYLGNGKFAAIGSLSPDSTNNIVSGLFCVWFDAEGTISGKKEIKESTTLFANRVMTDNSGNFFLAVCRKYVGSGLRATVAKYNSQFQKAWETELYNNPNFNASTLGMTFDNSGFIYVSGKTELSSGTSPVDNSFSVKLDNTGVIKWKKYLESSNTGSSVVIDKSGQLLILNYNCFRINVLNTETGTVTGVIRTFNACDAEKTDAFAKDFDINYDGNLIIAGSKAGGFYLVMKSPVSENPL